jgi:hypothetical protein
MMDGPGLIGVQFEQPRLARKGIGGRRKLWGQGPARTAPRGPDLDQDETFREFKAPGQRGVVHLDRLVFQLPGAAAALGG